jgi:hypothetical protein
MNTLTPHIDRPTLDRFTLTPPAALPNTTVVSSVTVEIVIPVYNEQRALQASVRKLHQYLTRQFTFAFQITIADNASTDATPGLARSLARELPEVQVLRLERKGRGHALRAAWSRSEADVLAYMDVDLSTDLGGVGELLSPLLDGRADVAIGSRLAPGAQVTRGIKRELISRGYNLLLRAFLGARFSDAQCGFKAGRREVVQALLDDVQDDDWFFDTELLYRSQQRGLAIHEVPVRWVDDPDSRVDILATARADLQGIGRLRRTPPRSTGGDDPFFGLRVAGDGEPDQDRHVYREDDERERQDDERPAAHVVAQEGVLDHAGDDHVGQQRPAGDLEETPPGEVPGAGQRREVAGQQQRRGGQQHDRGGERDPLRQVRGEIDAAGDDQRERGHPDLRDRRQAGLLAHPAASLVMITSVAICMMPVRPAVKMKRFISRSMT